MTISGDGIVAKSLSFFEKTAMQAVVYRMCTLPLLTDNRQMRQIEMASRPVACQHRQWPNWATAKTHRPHKLLIRILLTKASTNVRSVGRFKAAEESINWFFCVAVEGRFADEPCVWYSIGTCKMDSCKTEIEHECVKALSHCARRYSPMHVTYERIDVLLGV
jgi:hypothetical protein